MRSVAAFDTPHVHVTRSDVALKSSLDVPVTARTTGEHVETERAVLRERVDREV